jgi:tRNA 5-methylaminomethyl-2-thiouridine biosynthesis bifunctional protein
MLVGHKVATNVQAQDLGPHSRLKKIAIIGGGLAGATLAYSLSKRGAQVSLFEKQGCLFSGASGNERGVIMPQLSSKPDAQCRVFLAGFLHTVRLLKSLNQKMPFESFQQGGVIRYCNVAKWQSVYNKFTELGFDTLAEKIREEDFTALNFYDGSAISPSELGERLIKEAGGISINLNSEVTSVTSELEKTKITVNNSELEFDAVVFASAYGSAFIDSLSWIPIEKIKGELGIIKTPEGLKPRSMCYDGYVIPLPDNKTLIGATYEHNAHDETPSYTTTKDLYKRLQNYQQLPDLREEDYEGGRVCFRTTSPDRLPIIGPIEPNSNIYVSLGHGSRGLVSTPLSAELISQMIFNEPLSIEEDLYKEIVPSRYQERAKRREKNLEEIYPNSFLWRKTQKN